MWAYPEIRTLGDLPAYYARHDPDRPALIENQRTIGFAEFDRVADQVGRFLLSRGVLERDRVGFFGKNSADFYFAMFGCAKTRGCFTPFNWRLSAAELAEMIDDSRAKLAIVERELEPAWKQACALLKRPVEAVLIDAEDTLEALCANESGEAIGVWVSEEDSALQLYTSGTTGQSKGVMLTHGGFNRMRLCEHFEKAYDWKDGDSFLNPLPNFHLLHIGIAVQCLYNGVSITIVRQFDPPAVLRAIAEARPSLLTLTPTMLQMLLDHPDAAGTDFGSLRLTLYAGSPISLGLIKRAIAMMPCRFMQFYGATEANGAFSILRPDEHDLSDEKKLQSCGRPLPLIEFRILDPDGNEVPDGEPGELVIRSPAIAMGYWQQPEATATVLRHGWYWSGDVARRDADGLYYIVDRVKDMIVSGGENIYSAEVENVLSTHPGVAGVAVIGVPDTRWGEAVKAVIIRKEGQACDEASLIEHCGSRLASYKIPKSFDYVDSFPLVPSGKVSKKHLRARYWSAEARGVA
ncbi:MAG: hypothetical protein JWN69_1986 [Alphaproteobacteria bacterium]|nr:hypothetical protein [Alphaproteobacteria bacterium]